MPQSTGWGYDSNPCIQKRRKQDLTIKVSNGFSALLSSLLIPAEYSVVFGHSKCLARAGAARCAPTLYFANINKWSHLALDKLLQWANIAYIVCGAIAVAMTFAIYHLSARVNAAKDRELEKYRTESTIKITAAQAEAAGAMKIAESERLARAELESQVAAAEARAAEANAVASQARLELAKLKDPRTIAPEDQEKIIAALKEFAG